MNHNNKRIRKVCTECGSTDVLLDAYAVWNEETQEFELLTVYDKGHYCNQCDGPCSVKDEIIK